LHLLRFLLRPFGQIAFLVSVLALSCARKLLGEDDELGFFAGRLSGAIWRYPEVLRRGMQIAWILWAVLFAAALSPLDPIASRWDEVLLVSLPALVLWRRFAAGHRGAR
jgi:hypothetical protein